MRNQPDDPCRDPSSLAEVTEPERDAALARVGALEGTLRGVLEHVYALNDYTTRDYDRYYAACAAITDALRAAWAAGADEENEAIARLCDAADWRTSPAEIAALTRARKKARAALAGAPPAPTEERHGS